MTSKIAGGPDTAGFLGELNALRFFAPVGPDVLLHVGKVNPVGNGWVPASGRPRTGATHGCWYPSSASCPDQTRAAEGT